MKPKAREGKATINIKEGMNLRESYVGGWGCIGRCWRKKMERGNDLAILQS